MTSSVRDTGGHGLRDLIKELSRKASITAGIHAEQGAEGKKSPDPKAKDTSVIAVATAHEYGIGVRPRPFIGGWFDAQPDLHQDLSKVFRPVTQLKMPIEQAAARFGLWAAGQMKQRIADGIPPELTEFTKANKMSLTGQAKDTPLILTGQLRSAIRSKVEVK